MEITPEGTPQDSMSETFGNQATVPVVEKRPWLFKRVLNRFFSRKKDQATPPPSAEPLQQKADAVQDRLNEVKQGMAVDKQAGVPTGDAQTIARLEQEKGDLAAVGVTPNVGPVEPKMKFSTPPLPKFQKPGGTPTTAASTESLAAEVAKLAQADAKSEEVTPLIAETPEKAA